MNSQHQIPLYDLYDIWYTPFWHKPWFLLSTAFVFIVLMSIAIWLFLRKRKQNKKIDPWNIAIKQLKELDINQFKKPDSHKLFYSRITIIMKKYLTERYMQEFESKTDDEVIEILSQLSFSDDLRKKLKIVFDGAIYIKFSPYDAIIDHMKRDLEASLEVVQKTIPSKQPYESSALDTSDTIRK
jgi:hypothetical protein